VKQAILENTPLFAGLTAGQRDLIADRMVEETYRPGDMVCQHCQPATALYVIKAGWVRLMTEQFAVIANIGPGSMLGEADVLLGRDYTVTAEAASDVTLLALRSSELAAILAQDPQIGRQLRGLVGAAEDMERIRHLRRLGLFTGLGTDQLREVASYLRPEHFDTGQMVCRRGATGNALYLIEQGQVSLQAAGETFGSLGPGDFCGETAMLTGEPHSVDVMALTEVNAWALTRSDFEALVLRFPSLALNLSRMLSQRLRQTTEEAITHVHVGPARAVAPPAQPVAASAVPAAVTGLNRAADNVSDWFGARSTGAKLRLVAVILLLIWLLGVAAPSAIISLLGQTNVSRTAVNTAAGGLRDRVVLVALAVDQPLQTTPTYTPWPTNTPIPTPTFTPTATPTNTPIPTPTFTPTATPVPPTATPIPTPVPVVRAVAQAAPVALAAAEPPKPTVQFKLAEMRRLTPCENRGKHNIFIKVVDAAGNPVDGVNLVQTPAGQPGNVLDKMVSGAKGPGLAEFVMWKGAEYSVYVTNDGANPASTDIAQPLHSNFTDEAKCSDGEGGNTLFHNSFNVVFQKTF
jgi:CRP-like cAMP-binding protein